MKLKHEFNIFHETLNTNLVIQHVIQIRNGIMIHVNVSAKKCCNPNTCICENSRYLKSIADTLIILCDEIINGTDSVSTNVANTISTNVMSTV